MRAAGPKKGPPPLIFLSVWRSGGRTLRSFGASQVQAPQGVSSTPRDAFDSTRFSVRKRQAIEIVRAITDLTDIERCRAIGGEPDMAAVAGSLLPAPATT